MAVIEPGKGVREPLAVQSFQPVEDCGNADGVLFAGLGGSESICKGTQICTCDFTACCDV